MIYFTGDHHFGHANIIKYCNRPFKDTNQMERVIVTRYRSVVGMDDTVYFLGDLTLWSPEYKASLRRVVDQLPGTKILILGNHDKFNPFTYLELGFQSVHTSLEVEIFIDELGETGSITNTLVHDPAVTNIDPGRNWICGHVHNLFKKVKNIVNVSVEPWEYYPVSLEEVTKCRAGEDIV